MKWEKEHAVLAVFCLLVHLLVFLFLPGNRPDEFVDPDAYMRLVRSAEFLDTLDVRDHDIGRSNAPFGETLHWSRPMDVILVAGSWPLRLALGDAAGLSIFAYAVSPLLQACLLLVLLPALSPRLGRLNTFHFGFLLLCQPALLGSFVVGRPDHHSLLLLLFGAAVAVACARARSWPLGAGALSGLAAWVSVEALAICLPFYAFWGLRYIGGDERAPREALQFSLLWLLVAIPAVWIETPAQLASPTMADRLSGMHLLAVLLAAISWLGISRLPPSWFQRGAVRLAALAGVGGGSLVILLAVFPSLARGPYAEVDPELVNVWLNHVKEVQPLIASAAQAPKQLLAWLWPALLSLPWFIIRRRRIPALLAEPPVLLWTLATFLFTALACHQIRWVTYAELLWLLPCIHALRDALARIRESTRAPWQRPLVVGCILFFAGGNLVPVVALQRLEPQATSEASTGPDNDAPPARAEEASARELARALVDLSPREPKTILARLGLGPELLYRTHHRVIATPYHRNHAGMLYLREVMRESRMDAVRQRLADRGVDWILIEEGSPERSFYGTAELPDSFYERLRRDELPGGIERVLLPPPLEGRFRLFRVQAPGTGSGDAD